MKQKLFVTAMLVALVIPAVALAGPFFNISPGQQLQGMQLGMTFGKFEPYVGLDMMGISGKINIASDEDDLEASASASLFIPNIGTRFAFGATPLKPYVYLGFLKSFGSVSAKISEGSESLEFEGELKDQINDLMSFWGINAGFGAEYPFSEHFGVAGEYGFRYLKTHAEGEIDEDITDEINVSLRQSTARVLLSYKF